ncbi:antibiotic resistance protein MarC [Prosthecochloris sp. GSB1]|uniref:MarC family protein n=1 Tax=Prosthecochloris sp. GSB1 TaxID=281093 RepID=UPI000B8C7286|nr:MarC family protein [Prosthecochloris sp. GSB1]ASQ91235.1 antibiotic resistance protein MarC [Prosthecochloris sp. GSB1]
MLKTAAIAFATFFATIGPVDLAALLPALMPDDDVLRRRSVAVKAVLVAGGILLGFTLFGNPLLGFLGISLPAMRIAGGILLLLFGVNMVFGRQTGFSRSTDEEANEAVMKPDVAVFPLATPLIAGPASMGAAVLLTAETGGDPLLLLAVVAALAAVLAVTLLLFLLAAQVRELLGVTGLHVVSRTAGVLLTALAVQFMLDGVLSVAA